MSKKKVRLTLFILLVVLLIPIPMRYKDGGSVRYRAGLYDVTRYHWLDLTSETEYLDGWKVKILGITIFNNFD